MWRLVGEVKVGNRVAPQPHMWLKIERDILAAEE